MVKNVTQNKNGIMISVDVNVKKPLKHHVREENYVWNPTVRAFDSNDKCKINEYSNHCICMKSVFDNLVITCKDKTINTSTNSTDKKIKYKIVYYFLLTMLLVITCLFLIMIFAINCTFIKHQVKRINKNVLPN